MNDKALAVLADAIEARVALEVNKRIAPLEARLVEAGQIIADLSGRLATAEARIEQVAKEPRVSILPQFVVPTPAVHLAPTIQLPPRAPRKTKTVKGPDGSFTTEEID